MGLKLGHYDKDGIEVVDVEGEIDVFTAPRLRELLIDLASKDSCQLIVNMEKAEFLDFAGLGVLVGGLKRVRARGGWLDLACPRERILTIFRVTGLTKVFGIHQTVEQAIAARKSGKQPSLPAVTAVIHRIGYEPAVRLRVLASAAAGTRSAFGLPYWWARLFNYREFPRGVQPAGDRRWSPEA